MQTKKLINNFKKFKTEKLERKINVIVLQVFNAWKNGVYFHRSLLLEFIKEKERKKRINEKAVVHSILAFLFGLMRTETILGNVKV